MNLDKLKQEAREMLDDARAEKWGLRWNDDDDYDFLNTLVDRIASTLTDEMVHEWNKAEQRLDGTAQGAVNAIEQYRNYLTQVQTMHPVPPVTNQTTL